MAGQIKTVGELQDFLADKPREWFVVLAGDVEGNKYSPIADGDEARYLPENTWSGEIYPTDAEVDEELAKGDSDMTEDDRAPEEAEPVVCLWPTN